MGWDGLRVFAFDTLFSEIFFFLLLHCILRFLRSNAMEYPKNLDLCCSLIVL